VELSTLLWTAGVVVTANAGVAGWLFVYTNARFADMYKKLDGHDERMRNGITYVEADRLIDLKLAPIRDALERNTKATEKLTEVLLSRAQ
jgi:hypothetical protein